MKIITTKSLLFFTLVSLTIITVAATAQAKNRNYCYEVTITNLTAGQVFTPVLVVTHKRGLELFKEGEPASHELEQLAEGGDVEPLIEWLETMPHKVGAIGVSEGGPFHAGESVVVHLPFSKRHNHISLASMAAITNDGFVALNNVSVWKRMYTSPVYDAGSEDNDEMVDNIPGPGGTGYTPGGGEGFVHIHRGIHGIGDLHAPENLDWRNPAAKITISYGRCTAE